MASASAPPKLIEVGVTAIDHQHAEIFRRADQLMAAMREQRTRDELGRMIQFLTDYTERHFKAEEALMAAKSYPGLLEQRKEHSSFMATLRAMEARYATEGANSTLAIELNQLVGKWLREHIGRCDLAFAAFIRGSTDAKCSKT